MTGFATRLHQQIQRKRTPALIGIDPRWDWLPAEIRQQATAAGGNQSEIIARGFERFSLEILEIAAPHVAGALGRPVWVALRHVPDWRWLLEREDCPWYPTMRLFRQKTPGNWHTLFADMAEELRKRLA